MCKNGVLCLFSDRLVELRRKYGLTQKELAKILNITRSALSLYELGKREPDSEIYKSIADYFDITLDYLLGRSEKTTHMLYEYLAEMELHDLGPLPAEAIKEINICIISIIKKYKMDDSL